MGDLQTVRDSLALPHRRSAYLLIVAPILALLGLLNLRAHRPGDLESATAQLRFLRHALVEEAGAERMQAIFPEGYVFSWALYGLASAQVARQLDAADARREHHLAEAGRAVERVRSAQARAAFDPGLDPPHGAFYAAWSIYLLAEYVRAAGPDRVPPPLLASFEEECARFADALDRATTPFLPSYRHATWPADTAVGVAALGIHDAVLAPSFGATIASWVARARARLDPIGALSHAADSETGAPTDGARGSSLALMSRVLIDADAPFALEQYARLRNQFVDYRWGIPGVREYPHHVAGAADVDSGPLVFGYSGPAVVVGAAAARVHGDEALARVLLGAVEVAGMPIQLAQGRRYAGGFLPVGDAFIAWSRSSPPPDRQERAEWTPLIPRWWAVPGHALSAVLAALLLLLVVRRSKPRAARSQDDAPAAARR